MITQVPILINNFNKAGPHILHTKSRELKIYDLRKFKGCYLNLDLVKWKSDLPHEYLKLQLVKDDSYFRANGNGVVSELNDSFHDVLNLDFLSVERIRRTERNLSTDERKDKYNARLRMQLYRFGEGLGDKLIKYSKVIRLMKYQMTNELLISHIGFPPEITNSNERNVIITFQRPLVYYREEIDLYNEDEIISPTRNDDEVVNYIEFDLSKFRNWNYQILQLRCLSFGIKFYISTENIQIIYPYQSSHPLNGFSDLNPSTETFVGHDISSSYEEIVNQFRQTSLNAGPCNRHLTEKGKLIRCRYRSEIDKKNRTAFKFTIKNLKNHLGSNIRLDLVEWNSEERHKTMKFYKTKSDTNTVEEINFKIDESMVPIFNLDSYGIQIDKKMANGPESRNCCLRLALDGIVERSAVIRHLDSKLSESFKITSVAFPLVPDNSNRLLFITFSNFIPYYDWEFILVGNDEFINSLSIAKGAPCNTISFHVTFRNPLPPKLVLACPTFDRQWYISSYHITKIYHTEESQFSAIGPMVTEDTSTRPLESVNEYGSIYPLLSDSGFASNDLIIPGSNNQISPSEDFNVGFLYSDDEQDLDSFDIQGNNGELSMRPECQYTSNEPNGQFKSINPMGSECRFGSIDPVGHAVHDHMEPWTNNKFGPFSDFTGDILLFDYDLNSEDIDIQDFDSPIEVESSDYDITGKEFDNFEENMQNYFPETNDSNCQEPLRQDSLDSLLNLEPESTINPQLSGPMPEHNGLHKTISSAPIPEENTLTSSNDFKKIDANYQMGDGFSFNKNPGSTDLNLPILGRQNFWNALFNENPLSNDNDNIGDFSGPINQTYEVPVVAACSTLIKPKIGNNDNVCNISGPCSDNYWTPEVAASSTSFKPRNDNDNHGSFNRTYEGPLVVASSIIFENKNGERSMKNPEKKGAKRQIQENIEKRMLLKSQQREDILPQTVRGSPPRRRRKKNLPESNSGPPRGLSECGNTSFDVTHPGSGYNNSRSEVAGNNSWRPNFLTSNPNHF